MHKFHSKIISQVYYSAINIIFQHQDLNPLPSNSCFLARALPSLKGINLSSIDHFAKIVASTLGDLSAAAITTT